VIFGEWSPESEIIIAALSPEVPISLAKLSSSKNSASIQWN
jgi:hypothetical protein